LYIPKEKNADRTPEDKSKRQNKSRHSKRELTKHLLPLFPLQLYSKNDLSQS
jgi:hypothetical protein